MSVSDECKANVNDVIYFIKDCCVKFVTDENGIYDEDNSIEFKIGDKVYFLDSYDEMIGNNLYTKIKFKDKNDNIFFIVESFFATEDIWNDLKIYY